MAKLVLNTVLLAWWGGSEQEGRGGVWGRPLPSSLRVLVWRRSCPGLLCKSLLRRPLRCNPGASSWCLNIGIVGKTLCEAQGGVGELLLGSVWKRGVTRGGLGRIRGRRGTVFGVILKDHMVPPVQVTGLGHNPPSFLSRFPTCPSGRSLLDHSRPRRTLSQIWISSHRI